MAKSLMNKSELNLHPINKINKSSQSIIETNTTNTSSNLYN